MSEMALIPLESNPDVMTSFLLNVGVPPNWSLADVYVLDSESLACLPKPVLSVILLYPMTNKTEEYKVQLENKPYDSEKVKKDGVYHLKQFIPNACGTVALIHSIANNVEELNLQDGFAKDFINETKDLSSEERGERFRKASKILEAHEELAQEGQTEAPNRDRPVNHHFIAIVQKNGTLYELDGRKTHPIDHGKSSPESFLEDAIRVCNEYMQCEPDDMRFSIMALVNEFK